MAMTFVWITGAPLKISSNEHAQNSPEQASLRSSLVCESVNVITGNYCEVQTDMTLGSDQPLQLRRFYNDYTGWSFNYAGILAPLNSSELSEETSTNNNGCEYDQMRRLIAITKGHKAVNLSYRSLDQINTQDQISSHYLCHFKLSDGRHLHYDMQLLEDSKQLTKALLLNEITYPDGSTLKYHYRKHPTLSKYLVEKRASSSGQYLLTEYYEDANQKVKDPQRDFSLGKVKLQKAPLGVDHGAIVQNRFFYQEGFTEVRDAHNCKTIYRYSKEQVLTAVEHYTKEDQLYRQERLFWQTVQNTPKLLSKALLDGKGNVLRCYSYKYDSQGRTTSETLYGNLSGNCHKALRLQKNGVPVENGIEHYSTSYTYSDAKGCTDLILSQKEDNGRTQRYRYLEGSNLLAAKFVCQGDRIHIRYFYTYDGDGKLVKMVADDGTSQEADNLQGVTEQRSTLYTLNQGLPEGIEEYCLDLKSGLKKLLKRTINQYNGQGTLLSQEILLGETSGENDQFQSSLQYDACGRVTRSKDMSGNLTEYAYDTSGNKISEITRTSQGVSKQICYQYDLAKRLIRSDETIPDGNSLSNSYRYDYMGNKIASIDSFGNEIHYQYDEFGRLITTSHPFVLDAEGLSVQAIDKNSYDVCDNPIEVTDARGYTTRVHYNARAKPIGIVHPDGTIERFEYALDGSLISSLARNGSRSVYARDFLSRVTQAKVFSRSGEPLSYTSTKYNAFRIVSCKDALEDTLYDEMGRKKDVVSLAGKHIEYAYDAAGQQVSRKEWLEADPSNYLLYYTVRNARNEVVETSVVDSSGKILKQIVSDPSLHKLDSSDKIDYDFYNNRGQNVPQKSTTDSHGNTVFTIFDAMGRIETILKKDCMGQEFSRREMRYDLVGNKIRETHFSPTSQPYSVEWRYGPGKKLEAVIEGLGSTLARCTSYRYDNFGQLLTIQKPDGVLLNHEYNASGQLCKYWSSDGSIFYQYSYSQGNLVKMHDLVQGTTSERLFDHANQLIQETLNNGLTVRNQYDLQGRRTLLVLPDDSKVASVYDDRFLRAIHRLLPCGERLYTHAYSEYDDSGWLAKMQMIGELGEVSFKRNAAQITEMSSSYFSESTPADCYNDSGCLEKTVTKRAWQETSSHFEYDQSNQLIAEEGEFANTYLYDGMGNCIRKNECDWMVEDLNQLRQIDQNHYSYDRNGRLTKKSEGLSEGLREVTYEYDALDRLIRVTFSEGRGVTFTYDACHRRLTKQLLEWDSADQIWEMGPVERYLYDGNNEIGMVDSQDKIIQLRVLGSGLGAELGAAVAIELGGEVYAPLHDRRGSLCCLVDLKSRQPIEHYAYSAFGECQIRDSSLQLIDESIVQNPWQFLSKRLDKETGLNFFGKRYYDPHMGRWLTPDPLGFVDGLNRYAFVQNNPINQLDLYGLYSFSSFWWDVQAFFRGAYENVQSVVDYMQQASYYNYIKDDLERIGDDVIGRQYLILLGCYRDPMESGVYGVGEVGDKVRVTAINGMMNVRYNWMDSLGLISNTHNDVNVHYVFRPTEGWTWDMIKGGMVKAGYTSPQAYALAKTWKKLIKDMGGTDSGGIIIHYAHSIGGTDTSIAKHLLSAEEQKMIRVITTGSATLVQSGGFESVMNYVSCRDGVPMMVDPINYIQALLGKNDNVTFIGTCRGVPLVDHYLGSGAYYDLLVMLGKQFCAMYPPK